MRLPADPRLEAVSERLREVGEVIVFASSKGGVGKTLLSVTASLLLSRRGVGVGLLDLDITNPTAHLVLGVDPARVGPVEERGLVPPEVSGVRFMSPTFFTQGRAAPLRGEYVSSAIREVLSITRWVGVDALVVDTPPGMSDELLELLTYAGRFRAMVVSTPSVLALESAARLSEVLGSRVEALVLNMCSEGEPSSRRPEGLGERVPVYALPYDGEVEEAVGDPRRLLSTRFSREVDRQVVGHIAGLLGSRRPRPTATSTMSPP